MIHMSPKWGHGSPPFQKNACPQARENMNDGTFGHFSANFCKLLHTPFELHILHRWIVWKYFICHPSPSTHELLCFQNNSMSNCVARFGLSFEHVSHLFRLGGNLMYIEEVHSVQFVLWKDLRIFHSIGRFAPW